MSILALLLAAGPQPGLAPLNDNLPTIELTLTKLEALRHRLSRDRAEDKDLAEQEARLVATLDDLQLTLDEALNAVRLSDERLRLDEQDIGVLAAKQAKEQKRAKDAAERARLALTKTLRGNHVGGNKPILRAYRRAKLRGASQLWREAVAADQALEKRRQELKTKQAKRTDLRERLEKLLAERQRVRGAAKRRLAEVRSDRQRAKAHAAALENQRLALARWLEQIKPALKDPPADGLKRGQLIPPVAGRIVNGYGWQEAKDRLSRWRNRGLDLGGAPGSPVVASAVGRVAFVGRSPGLGLAVVLDHGDGWRTLYGGLAKANLEVGDDIDGGSVLGLLGDSGRLHFELRRGQLAVNPTKDFRRSLGP